MLIDAFAVAWGLGVMCAALYGYSQLGFSWKGFAIFCSGLFCFIAGLL